MDILFLGVVALNVLSWVFWICFPILIIYLLRELATAVKNESDITRRKIIQKMDEVNDTIKRLHLSGNDGEQKDDRHP